MANAGNVEDLADCLASSFNVSNIPNDPNRPHPRFSQYKNKPEGSSSQEVRRERLLQIQKKRRDNFLAVARALAQGNVQDDDSFSDEEELAWMEEDEPEAASTATPTTKIKAQKLLDRLQLKSSYRKQLMQSEWLVDLPSTLESDWLALPVPEGKRNLVIAAEGQTKVFSRSGTFVNKFPSILPGGSRCREGNGDVTILDTIFSPISRTFYVIDCMVWNGYAYYGCDTEFRWFWMSGKFEEKPSLSNPSKFNTYPFVPLPAVAADVATLNKTFSSEVNFKFDPLPIDGVLFYHKRVHYLPGVTPLVGWLKVYMMPEMLGVTVCEKLMRNKPNNYSSMSGYISHYNKKSAGDTNAEMTQE